MIFMKHIRKFESFSINEEVMTLGGMDLDPLGFGFLTKEEAEKRYSEKERVNALQILNKQFGMSELGTKFAELIDLLLTTSPLSPEMKSPNSYLGARKRYFDLLDGMKTKQDQYKIDNLKIFITQFAKKMEIIKDDKGKLITVAGSTGPSGAKESYNWRR